MYAIGTSNGSRCDNKKNALSFQCNDFQLPLQYSCENIPTTDLKSHEALQ